MEKIKLEVSVDFANRILLALSKMPWDYANPVLVEIQPQIQKQVNSFQAPAS